MHPLDEATTLVACGPGQWRGRATDTYWNMVGPHGGVIASILLRGVLVHEARIGDPCAITVNFTAAIARGDFQVSARVVRTGKSVQHWYVELNQSDVVAANATVVCSARRTTWRHLSATHPSAPPPGTLEPMRTDRRSGFLPNFDLRFVEGSPAFGSGYDGVPRSPRTCLWLNNAVPRSLDFIGLTTLCDMFFCRIFHVQACVFPVATVSMTAYFHADADGVATVVDRPLLGVADANVFELGFHDQYAQLWSPEGTLLATTSQIVNYR